MADQEQRVDQERYQHSYKRVACESKPTQEVCGIGAGEESRASMAKLRAGMVHAYIDINSSQITRPCILPAFDTWYAR
jgi:hypothetical protein